MLGSPRQVCSQSESLSANLVRSAIFTGAVGPRSTSAGSSHGGGGRRAAGTFYPSPAVCGQRAEEWEEQWMEPSDGFALTCVLGHRGWEDVGRCVCVCRRDAPTRVRRGARGLREGAMACAGAPASGFRQPSLPSAQGACYMSGEGERAALASARLGVRACAHLSALTRAVCACRLALASSERGPRSLSPAGPSRTPSAMHWSPPLGGGSRGSARHPEMPRLQPLSVVLADGMLR